MVVRDTIQIQSYSLVTVVLNNPDTVLQFSYGSTTKLRYNPNTIQIQSYSSVQLQSLKNNPEGLGTVLQFYDLKNLINTPNYSSAIGCYYTDSYYKALLY